MADKLICNASPLILLAKVGRLELLESNDWELVVPDVVVKEILAGPPTDPAVVAIKGAFGKQVCVGEIPEQVKDLKLDPGESGVIALGLRYPGSRLVIDERRGRKAAEHLKLNLTSCLELVIYAKKQNRISSARDVVRELVDKGARLKPKLISDALRRVAEEWDEEV